MRVKSTYVVLYIYRMRKFSSFRDLVLSTDAGLGIVYFCTKSAKIITSNVSRAACFILGRQKSNAPVSGVFKGRGDKGRWSPKLKRQKVHMINFKLFILHTLLKTLPIHKRRI